jgi:hypothetical protein
VQKVRIGVEVCPERKQADNQWEAQMTRYKRIGIRFKRVGVRYKRVQRHPPQDRRRATADQVLGKWKVINAIG